MQIGFILSTLNTICNIVMFHWTTKHYSFLVKYPTWMKQHWASWGWRKISWFHLLVTVNKLPELIFSETPCKVPRWTSFWGHFIFHDYATTTCVWTKGVAFGSPFQLVALPKTKVGWMGGCPWTKVWINVEESWHLWSHHEHQVLYREKPKLVFWGCWEMVS